MWSTYSSVRSENNNKITKKKIVVFAGGEWLSNLTLELEAQISGCPGNNDYKEETKPWVLIPLLFTSTGGVDTKSVMNSSFATAAT